MKRILLVFLIALCVFLIGCKDKNKEEREKQIKEIQANTQMSDVEKFARIEAVKKDILIDRIVINDDMSTLNSGKKIVLLYSNGLKDKDAKYNELQNSATSCVRNLANSYLENKINNVSEICLMYQHTVTPAKASATKVGDKYEIEEGI